MNKKAKMYPEAQFENYYRKQSIASNWSNCMKLNLMQCFHWNRPYDPRVGCKSRRVGRKSAGKWWVGYEIPDRMVKLQTGCNGHPDKPKGREPFLHGQS